MSVKSQEVRKRKPGRPRILVDRVVFNLSLQAYEKARLEELGGAAWVRAKINETMKDSHDGISTQ